MVQRPRPDLRGGVRSNAHSYRNRGGGGGGGGGRWETSVPTASGTKTRAPGSDSLAIGKYRKSNRLSGDLHPVSAILANDA